MPLSSLLGDTLLTKDGEKKTDEVHFSAHWCGPCRMFTPAFSKTYEALKAANKPFETVFVSSDRDEGSFSGYYGEQPWTALPFAARDVKAKLSKKFKVQGIPTVVLLDGEGKTITANGRGVIANDPQGANFPWPKKSVHELLGGDEGEFLSQGDGDVTLKDLEGKTLGLYFSAHWCPPCKGFTPKLIEAYEAVKKTRDDFEIIFVSSDHSAAEFSAYAATMPWLAIPPNDKRKAALSEHFEVEGIPTFIMLGPDGEVINANARGAVMGDPEGASFPWPKPLVQDVDEGADDLNEMPCLVAFLSGLDDAGKAAAKEALAAVAKARVASAKAAGEDPEFAFYTVAKPDGPVSSQIRNLTGKARDSPGVASFILLDVQDNGAYFEGEGTEVTEDTVNKVLDGYKGGALLRKQLGGA